ncbi:H-type small acid-soluble spore protein [Haloimpatiens sp. FM7315]|uniref:H-type small acid-soluble spore protein n=1 Tax=Haloimpatiens sp. FM7315 TaxID=3298609 RepID=UPI0035A3B5E0
MDYSRAKQIMESKNNIPVYYKNTPVWIKKLDKDKGTCEVTNLNTDNHMIVPTKTLNDINLK